LIVAKPSTWVGLSEAAKILGVHPATVRSWADRGDLPTQRTPGGHRRFRRSDLTEWITHQGVPSPAEAQLLVQSAMGRARLEIGGGHMAQADWYQRLNEEARSAMSLHGRRLMDALQRYFATPDGNLTEAHSIGFQYGRTIRSQGLSLPQAVEGFFTFNDFILDAMLQMAEISRPGIDQAEAIRKIYSFTRTIIIALIEAYEE
jgi:excisionase family DNA binding protein